MPAPTLTPPPAAGPPLTTDRVNFAARGDDWNSWIAVFFYQLVAFVTWLTSLGSTYALSMSGTATSASLAVGTGSKGPFTAQTGLGFTPGATIYIANGTNQMVGDVTSYNSGTGALMLNATQAQGAGSFTTWTVGPATLSGLTPATGTELLAGASTAKAVTPDAAADAKEPNVQTIGGTFTPSLATTAVHEFLLSSNLILNFPNGIGRAGQPFSFRFKQPASGGPYTITAAAAYRLPNAGVATLSTGANIVDELSGRILSGATTARCSFAKNC